MQKEINSALQVLINGGIILYPTDTIWGIGCDATNSKAIEKIYKIKKRTESKALISLVSDKTQLQNITNSIPNFDITTKPTTIIFPNIIGISSNLLAKDSSAAIRIVNDKFCNELIQQFGKPIVSTSANISGSVFPKQFSEITDEIKTNVDYVVNLRQAEIMNKPSQIILINMNGSIKKLR
jgi:L-threonylcarbamoyladenylate synthase